MLTTSLIYRWLVCAGVACGALGAESPESPNLTETFSFTLNQRRDDAIRHTIEMMRVRDEMQRMRDLKTADASVFARAIDLFRFVPFKLSSSDSKPDDFFTPNYLRPDYNRPVSDAHLFDKP